MLGPRVGDWAKTQSISDTRCGEEREGVLMKNYLNIKIYGMNISWLSVSFIEARDASDFKSILDQSKSLRLILRKS